ncbi:MAG: DnaJ domain-containing protein [Candidatus Moranbacteria bacterium]|nr:DnaJ domain-containing protein [Candidatus Moranbacteria bacterium]
MKNCYQILGVSEDADFKEIRQAYIKLMHKVHPDKGGDHETCLKVCNAYRRVCKHYQKKGETDWFFIFSIFSVFSMISFSLYAYKKAKD